MEKLTTADFLRHLRNRIGLNQAEMAKPLNISASLVGMVENNQRMLPVEAEEKLKILFDHYREVLAPLKHDLPPCGHASDRLSPLYPEVEWEKLTVEKTIGELERSLASMKKTYCMHLNFISNINRVYAIKKEPTIWDEVIHKSYIKAIGALSTCGLIMQERLQLQIERLQAEGEVIDRHLEIIGG